MYLESVQYFTHAPWWAVIIIASLGLRLLLSPLQVKTLKVSAISQKISPQLRCEKIGGCADKKTKEFGVASAPTSPKTGRLADGARRQPMDHVQGVVCQAWSASLIRSQIFAATSACLRSPLFFHQRYVLRSCFPLFYELWWYCLVY